MRADPQRKPTAQPLRLDLAGFARDVGIDGHDALMALVERADALGFGGIWFNEFHFRRDTLPYPSTLLLGAEVLARTRRLRFGTSVLVLPLHHPLLLAEAIAQLDRQSGGRIDVGIGRSTEPETLQALDIDPANARTRFEESLAVLLDAWTQSPISSPGPTWPFADVAVGPPPIQKPHPPIHVAGVSRETIAIAARHGFPLLLSLEPNEARQIPVFRQELARTAWGTGPLAASSLSRYVVVAQDRDSAERDLSDLLDRLNQARAARSAKQGRPPPEPRSRATMLSDFAIAGTPQSCAEQIIALARQTGIRNIRLLFSANGLIPIQAALAALELFAAEVMPRLADFTVPPIPAPELERT